MACYNGERYIEYQLDSLLMQTHKVDECIIVDDCSGDSTTQIIEAYIKKNKLMSWKLIRNKDNCGYIESFRKALSLAKGEIIFLADQDDVWEKKKVEIMCQIMSNHNDILSLCSSFYSINQFGEQIPTRSPIFTENHGLIILRKMQKEKVYKITLKEIISRNIAMGCTMAIRRELVSLYLRKGPNEIPHDWEINFWAATRNGLFYLNSELTLHRIHGNNTSEMKVDPYLSRGYRIQEYKKYIKYFNEYKRMIQELLPMEKKVVVRFKELSDYYALRIKALENRSPMIIVEVIMKFWRKLGIEALLSVVDIPSMIKK